MNCVVTVPVQMHGHGSRHAGRSAPSPSLVLTVMALHVAAVALVCLVAVPRQAPPPPQAAVAMVFAPAAPRPIETPPQTIASSTMPVAATEVAAALEPIPKLVSQAEVHVAAPRTPPRLASPAVRHDAPALTQQTVMIQAPAHPPVVASAVTAEAAPSGDLLHALAAWEARIRQAVQDATIYPASARLLRREGRVRVQFDYDDGAVAAASILQTSHVAALDEAALAAVTRASMPAPPAGLGAQKRTMLVWVQFKLVSYE